MFKSVFHGICIGIANIIPGVSGGTIAVVLGIYDRLIHSISVVTKRPFGSFKELLFLLQIFIGAVIGIKGFAGLIQFCLDIYPFPTHYFFIGLILGSVPLISKQHSDLRVSIGNGIGVLCGILVLIWMSTLSASGASFDPQTYDVFSLSSVLFLLGSGFVAAGAMVIPGISGSFLLLVLGTYPILLYAVDEVELAILGVIGVGALLGIVLCSRFIDWCLKRFPGFTYAFILGLLFGSAFQLFPGVVFDASLIVSLATFGVGGLVSFYLGKS